ncbi:hypothetical protein [Rhizobium sp. 2TAF27]|uniref:hypothetical protein n=1 Tax=Rhizobium sp. 2TAF27 TaxID=3233013 RepID=UPI003F9B2912
MGGFAPSAENDANDRCRLISMISATAGAITSPVVLPTCHLIREETLRWPFVSKREGETGKAARLHWNGFETFDLFDAPGSSGTNNQIKEVE